MAVDNDDDVLSTTAPTGGAASWRVSHFPAALVGGNTEGGETSITCRSTRLCLIWGPTLPGILVATRPGAGAGAWRSNLAGGNAIQALSCPSAQRCVAIDYSDDVLTSTDPGAGARAQWKVTARHIDQSALTRQAHAGVTALSCPSAKLCVAVDGAGQAVITTDPSGPAAAWRIADIDPPSMAEGEPPLAGVSCPSAQLCVAVDQYDDIATSTRPTAGARAWTLNGPTSAGLNLPYSAVSCASTTLCAVAGVSGVGNGDDDVLVSRDPTSRRASWEGAAVDHGAIQSISCPTASLCVAGDGRGEVIVGRRR